MKRSIICNHDKNLFNEEIIMMKHQNWLIQPESIACIIGTRQLLRRHLKSNTSLVNIDFIRGDIRGRPCKI